MENNKIRRGFWKLSAIGAALPLLPYIEPPAIS